MKTGLYPEDVVVAFASRAIKRPVRWTAERIEEFLAATQGRDVESRAELALDANGKVLAYRVRSLANMGAYAGTVGIIIQLLVGPWSRPASTTSRLSICSSTPCLPTRLRRPPIAARVDPRRFI